MGVESKKKKTRKCEHCKRTLELTAAELKKHAAECGVRK